MQKDSNVEVESYIVARTPSHFILENDLLRSHNVLMAKNYDREKYRKPSKATRVKKRLADAAIPAMEQLALDFTDFVNEAVREKLEKMGFWPPKELEDQTSKRKPKPAGDS
jgi:hypothetical protein